MSADREFEAAEARRRLNQVIRYGTVAAVDYPAARVRLRIGELVTAWLPFLAARAGGDRSWHPPEIGEQVAVAAAGGDLNQGVVLGAIYADGAPAPGDRGDLAVTVWGDGARDQYDRAAHERLIDVPAGGRIILRCGRSSITIADGQITLAGPKIKMVKA